jgi:hypothetical protein
VERGLFGWRNFFETLRTRVQRAGPLRRGSPYGPSWGDANRRQTQEADTEIGGPGNPRADLKFGHYTSKNIPHMKRACEYNRGRNSEMTFHGGGGMEPRRGRVASILTDAHFWVPAAVLVGGLLLLRFLH